MSFRTVAALLAACGLQPAQSEGLSAQLLAELKAVLTEEQLASADASDFLYVGQLDAWQGTDQPGVFTEHRSVDFRRCLTKAADASKAFSWSNHTCRTFHQRPLWVPHGGHAAFELRFKDKSALRYMLALDGLVHEGNNQQLANGWASIVSRSGIPDAAASVLPQTTHCSSGASGQAPACPAYLNGEGTIVEGVVNMQAGVSPTAALKAVAAQLWSPDTKLGQQLVSWRVVPLTPAPKLVVASSGKKAFCNDGAQTHTFPATKTPEECVALAADSPRCNLVNYKSGPDGECSCVDIDCKASTSKHSHTIYSIQRAVVPDPPAGAPSAEMCGTCGGGWVSATNPATSLVHQSLRDRCCSPPSASARPTCHDWKGQCAGGWRQVAHKWSPPGGCACDLVQPTKSHPKMYLDRCTHVQQEDKYMCLARDDQETCTARTSSEIFTNLLSRPGHKWVECSMDTCRGTECESVECCVPQFSDAPEPVGEAPKAQSRYVRIGYFDAFGGDEYTIPQFNLTKEDCRELSEAQNAAAFTYTRGHHCKMYKAAPQWLAVPDGQGGGPDVEAFEAVPQTATLRVTLLSHGRLNTSSVTQLLVANVVKAVTHSAPSLGAALALSKDVKEVGLAASATADGGPLAGYSVAAEGDALRLLSFNITVGAVVPMDNIAAVVSSEIRQLDDDIAGWTVAPVHGSPSFEVKHTNAFCGSSAKQLGRADSAAECALHTLLEPSCTTTFYVIAGEMKECGCTPTQHGDCAKAPSVDANVYTVTSELVSVPPPPQCVCRHGKVRPAGKARDDALADCKRKKNVLELDDCVAQACCAEPGTPLPTAAPTPKPAAPPTTPATPPPHKGESTSHSAALGMVVAVTIVVGLGLLGGAYVVIQSRRQAAQYRHVGQTSPGAAPRRPADTATGLQGGVLGDAARDLRLKGKGRRSVPREAHTQRMSDFTDGEPTEAPPVILLESCRSWPALCGTYRKQTSVVRDMPWWRRDGGGGWLANDKTYDVWMFSIEEQHFENGVGWVKSGDAHGGSWPHTLSHWETYSFKTSSWEPDGDVCVVARYEGAQGGACGQVI